MKFETVQDTGGCRTDVHDLCQLVKFETVQDTGGRRADVYDLCQLVKLKTFQDTGGRRTDVHDLPVGESSPPHRTCFLFDQQPWMRHVLPVLRLSDAAYPVSGRLVPLLHLQPLQQALHRETLAEMDTSCCRVNGRTSKWTTTSWSSG